MVKLFKTVVVVLLTLVFLVAATVFVVFTFYKKELTALLIDSLYANYGLTLKVDDIKVSFLSNWPHASVQLRNVILSNAAAQPASLLKAGSVSLSFNIEKMLHRKFIVKYVAIKDAEIDFIKNRTGHKNFEITQSPRNAAVKDEPISFEVSRIALRNVRFRYVNEERGQNIRIAFLDDNIHLNHYSDGIKADFDGRVFIGGLLFHPRRGEFLTNCHAELDLSITYFKETQSFCIQPPSKARIDKHDYNVASVIEFAEDKKLSLVITSEDVDCNAVARYLTPRIRKVLAPFALKNTVDVKALISVHIGKREDPVLLVDISGTKNSLVIGTSRIPYSNLDFTARIISLDTSLTRGNIEQARIIFLPVRGNMYDFPFTSTITVSNLKSPVINIKGNLLLEGAKIKSHIKNEFRLAGSCVVKFTYSGPTDQMNTAHFLSNKMRLRARLFLNHFSYQEINRPYLYTLNGRASLNNTDLKFDKLQLITDFGKAFLEGKVEKFTDFVIGNSNGFRTILKAVSDSLNLDPLFVKRDTAARPVEARMVKKEPAKMIDEDAITPRGPRDHSKFEFAVSLNAKKISVRNVRAGNARVELAYKDEVVNIKSMSADICEGRMTGKVRLNNFRKLNAELSLYGVNVTSLFGQFGNFGQSVIVSGNIKGRIDLTGNFSSYLDNKMGVMPQTMGGEMKLTLKDGHIVNFEPIQNLSNFLFKNRNFNDVAFSEINESFKMEGYKMEIKELEVGSNLLDLYVEGTYNFKGNSNMNIVIPWNNLKRRGKNYIPKISGKSAQDTRGLKLNVSGLNNHMKISMGHKSG
jgi:hypothetical protein